MRRNCDYCKDVVEACEKFEKSTGKSVYNCCPKFTSSGDLVEWLLSPVKFKDMTRDDKLQVIREYINERKCISDIDMLDFLSGELRDFGI